MTVDHNAKISKLKDKLKSTKHYLVKQNQEVVKPLIQEMKLSEELK